tara:strand:+ start:315 stop:533 length:219 start_codon:yes stop_codon:yes gene_type:complete
MKVRKFKTDEWVEYHQFPDSEHDTLRDTKVRAVVLEVLHKRDIYDYRIYLDNGTSTILKVKEKNLFPHNKTK